MKTLCIAISAILISTHAMADDNSYIRNGNIYSNQGQYFVGAGVATGSKFFKGQDDQTAAYFNGGYHGEDFNADLSGINYRFFGNNDSAINFSAYVVANPGFDADSEDVLKGMKERDFSGDLGLNADFHLGQGTLSAKFQHDITGAYDGYQADITYYHPMDLGFASLVPYAGAHYFSKEFVNYYAGVASFEATSKRPAYQSNGALAFKVGYVLDIPITENLSLTQSTAYTHLGSNMANSPIIDTKNQWLTTFGVNYSF